LEPQFGKLAPVDSQVSIHHLRTRAGLVVPVSVYSDCMGYHFLSVAWYFSVPSWVWTSYSRSDKRCHT